MLLSKQPKAYMHVLEIIIWIDAYRICSNGCRGYNYFLVRKDAASIWGRLLFKYIRLKNLCNHPLLARNSPWSYSRANLRALHWAALQVTRKFSAHTLSIHRISNFRDSVTKLRGKVNNLQLKRVVKCSLLYCGSVHSPSVSSHLQLSSPCP